MDREPASWKKDYVASLTRIIQARPVVGIVNVGGIPGPQIQKMRADLRGRMDLMVSSNNLLRLALERMEAEKSGISQLKELVDGQCAIVGADENPFKLFKLMESTKTAAPAKGGEIAPEDINVKAGDTPFKPGPIVGDLQQAGIPAAIEGGKVVIKKDKTLVKAGEKIPTNIAQMLTKLEIFPMTVGMDLRGVYEDGTVFTSDVLAIDEEKFMGDLLGSIAGAFNLACNIGYVTPLTIRPLIAKASMDAMNLALNAGVVNDATVKPLLGLAGSRMLALAGRIPDALDDDLRAMLGAAASAAASQASRAQEPDKEDEKKEEPEEEEEVSEEEAAAGLGALFG